MCNMVTQPFDCQASKEKVPETLDPVVLIQQLTKALAVALVRFGIHNLCTFHVYKYQRC